MFLCDFFFLGVGDLGAASLTDYVDLFDGAAHCIQTQHLNTRHGQFHHMITGKMHVQTTKLIIGKINVRYTFTALKPRNLQERAAQKRDKANGLYSTRFRF